MAADPSAWEIISSVATALGVLLSAGGLIYLGRQIQLQRAETRLAAINMMLSEINTPDQRRALQFIFSKQPADLVWDSLSEAERDHIELTIAHLGRLGFRLRHYPELATAQDEVYELFWETVIKSAQQLRCWRRDQCKRRGYDHAMDFTWLAREFKLLYLRSKGALPKAWEKATLDELLEIEPLKVWSPTQKRQEELS